VSDLCVMSYVSGLENDTDRLRAAAATSRSEEARHVGQCDVVDATEVCVIVQEERNGKAVVL
jgi:hypothetical protein